MADTKLIIKISEEVYKNIQNKSTEIQAEGYTIENAILNSTLLPKGHGRLIDADDIDNHIIGSVDTRDCPTIIEADKESEE